MGYAKQVYRRGMRLHATIFIRIRAKMYCYKPLTFVRSYVGWLAQPFHSIIFRSAEKQNGIDSGAAHNWHGSLSRYTYNTITLTPQTAPFRSFFFLLSNAVLWL